MTITLAQAIDWQTPMTDALTAVATFVPRLLAFLAILFVARLVAKAIQRGVTFLLQRMKFDAVMDRAGVGAPLERAGFADAGAFVAKVAYYAILLLGLQLAISVFGPNPISDLINSVVAFIPKAIVAMAIIVVTGLIVRAVNNVLAPAYANMDMGRLARTGVTGAIWMIGIFATLDQIEVAQGVVTTLFTTIVGSLGLVLVIMFGVGGIWEAKERFWPAVFDRVSSTTGRDEQVDLVEHEHTTI